jgi:hypothetical protein
MDHDSQAHRATDIVIPGAPLAATLRAMCVIRAACLLHRHRGLLILLRPLPRKKKPTRSRGAQDRRRPVRSRAPYFWSKIHQAVDLPKMSQAAGADAFMMPPFSNIWCVAHEQEVD